jgi:hypothetical protein
VGRNTELDFRFCPSCGTPQRSKIVEHFQGVEDLDDGGLRVSVYLTHPQHVRLSIWKGDHAQAAMSLSPREAKRLGDFLNAHRRHSKEETLQYSLRKTAGALSARMRALLL